MREIPASMRQTSHQDNAICVFKLIIGLITISLKVSLVIIKKLLWSLSVSTLLVAVRRRGQKGLTFLLDYSRPTATAADDSPDAFFLSSAYPAPESESP